MTATQVKVLQAIQSKGPISTDGICAATGIGKRTVRYNISQLRRMGAIGQKMDMTDLRVILFFGKEVSANV